MFKKIKGTIDKIKVDLDPRRAKFRKEVLEQGIFNLKYFASEKGLVVLEVENELNDLMNEGQLRGYYTFDNTEFATYDYLKEHINENLKGKFKLDLKKFSKDYGISLEVLYEIINDLIGQNLLFGFFDVPENNTFFILTQQEQNQFILKLRKEKIHLTELAEFIDNFIETKQDIDIGSLINDIQDIKEEKLNDWDLLAKDVIDSTLGKKRAKIWIENLITRNKINGYFTKNDEFFIPQDAIDNEIVDYINSSGRVKLTELQNKFKIDNIITLKIKLGIFEKERLIKGFFVNNDEEFATLDKLLAEIEAIIKNYQQEIIDIKKLQKRIGLDLRTTAALIRKLIKNNILSGLISADSTKFFTFALLNNKILNFIEKNDRIKIKDINKDFKLANKDLINHIETLISRYNIRVLLTWDKSEIVKEEKIVYELLEILKKSKKSLLIEVVKASKIEGKQVIRLINYMLEFGIIKGKLTNKAFTLK